MSERNKRIGICSPLVVIVGVMLCLSATSFGAEPVSVSHSISAYTDNGPTVTLELNLQIANNTTAALSGTVITTAPMGPLHSLLGPTPQEAAVLVGDIPSSGTVSVDFIIESDHIMSEEIIDHMPFFWEITYTNDTGEQQMAVVRSESLLSEPLATTETTSAVVSSLSSFGVIEEWVARYDGPANSWDYAQAVAVDASGNVYVTGYSFGSSTSIDYATIKYDSSGNEQWVARYDGPSSSRDYALAVAVDSSGNVYVTGHSDGGSTGYDYATIKYDSSGDELWVARYDGPASGDDDMPTIAIAADSLGQVYVYVTGRSGGTSSEDYATVKYDPSGNELWAARYNGPANGADWPTAIAVDISGTVYVTGHSRGDSTRSDFATIRYDSSGNELWVARYNGPISSADGARAMALDVSGNVYVAGWSGGSTSFDYATVKYDSSGNELWVARYDGPANGEDWIHGITLDASGSVYVAGQSDGGSTSTDYATIKYDSSGNEQWVARYDGPANGYDLAYAIDVDVSGNVFVTGESYGGSTSIDYATIKYDSSGTELWVAIYDYGYDVPYALAVGASGELYVTGRSIGGGTSFDYGTIKYVSEDPAKLIESLIAAVISLNLHNGIANSLDAKLGAALGALDDVNANNDVAAISTLEAFINAVEAQRGKEISESDADALIQAAVITINVLSSP